MTYDDVIVLALKLRRRGLSYPAISAVFAELHPEWTFSEGWFRDQLRGQTPQKPRGMPYGSPAALDRLAA